MGLPCSCNREAGVCSLASSKDVVVARILLLVRYERILHSLVDRQGGATEETRWAGRTSSLQWPEQQSVVRRWLSGEESDLVVEGVDLEVEEADLDAEGTNREGLTEGSSSERETTWEEKERHTIARCRSEATRRVASPE
jgi:hypothetical protein